MEFYAKTDGLYRGLHTLCTEILRSLGQEDFFGVHRVVAQTQVKNDQMNFILKNYGLCVY